MRSVTMPIRENLRILVDPDRSFAELAGRSLDSVVQSYIITLLFGGLLAALISSAVWLFFLGVSSLFGEVDIHYLNALNLISARASSLLFVYIFSGTIVAAGIAYLVNPLQHRYSFVDFLKVLMYCATPLIFFGWIVTPIPALIWSITLFIASTRHYRAEHISKTSIKHRY